HTIRLDPSAFAGFNVDGYQDVWLMYQEDQAGALSSNWEDCQQSQSTRTTEGWTIVVAPAQTADDITVDGLVAVTLSKSVPAAGSSPPPPGAGPPPVIADD